MWISKGTALIRRWRLFEARRLLEETRYVYIHTYEYGAINSSTALIRGRRLFETRRLLEETRCVHIHTYENVVINSRVSMMVLFKQCNKIHT